MATHFEQRSRLLIDLLGFGMTRWSTFGIHANRFLSKASELTLDVSDMSFTEREEIVLCHRLADRSSQNCQSLGICSRAPVRSHAARERSSGFGELRVRIGTAIRAQRPSFVLLYNGEGAAAYHRGDEAKGEEFKRTAKVGAP